MTKHSNFGVEHTKLYSFTNCILGQFYPQLKTFHHHVYRFLFDFQEVVINSLISVHGVQLGRFTKHPWSQSHRITCCGTPDMKPLKPAACRACAEGINRWLARTASENSAWQLGRGTYAAVITRPEKEICIVQDPVPQNNHSATTVTSLC